MPLVIHHREDLLMDRYRVDALARALATVGTRRGLLSLLAVLALLPGLGWPSLASSAKKKKGKKKVTLCLDGRTLRIRKSKKKRKKIRKLRKRGATPGACQAPPPVCAPACSGTTCGGDDGCGGVCGCPANALCHEGFCKPFDIDCPPGRDGCGADLQALLSAGGTVIAGPGRYVGTYFLNRDVTLIGTGDGNDPATSTILDANRTGRVIDVNSNIKVTLQSIRVQGGRPNFGGGSGVRNLGILAMTDCTVMGNETTGSDGGISSDSSLTLTRCRVTSNKAGATTGGIGVGGGTTTLVRSIVSQNEAASNIGGIFVAQGGTLWLTENSQVTGNRADGIIGGISCGGTVVLDATSSVTENRSGSPAAPSGISKFGAGTVLLNSATVVSGNLPEPQCSPGIGC